VTPCRTFVAKTKFDDRYWRWDKYFEVERVLSRARGPFGRSEVRIVDSIGQVRGRTLHATHRRLSVERSSPECLVLTVRCRNGTEATLSVEQRGRLVRSTIRVISPSEVQAHGLVAALETHLAAISNRHRSTDEPALPQPKLDTRARRAFVHPWFVGIGGALIAGFILLMFHPS
jgi:hypothetical protein